MSELLSLNIVRTENLNINGQSYTLRFAKSQDEQEFQFLLSNDSSHKQASCHVSKETANDFETQTGEDIVSLVTDVFKNDIDAGKV